MNSLKLSRALSDFSYALIRGRLDAVKIDFLKEFYAFNNIAKIT